MVTKYVILNSRDQLLRINLAEVVYFEADGNLTYIITVNKIKGTVSMNLGKMEEFLAAQFKGEIGFFLRVGKKYIINLNYIYMVHVAKQKLVLSDLHSFAFQISVSKDALKKVKDIVVITNN